MTERLRRDSAPVVAMVSSVGDLTDSHTLLYARTLARHGAKVVLMRPGDASAVSAIDGLATQPLPEVRFNFWPHQPGLWHLFRAMIFRLANTVRLVGRIRAMQPDVVVATEPDAWLAALVARLGRRRHRLVEDLREIYEDRASAFPWPLNRVVFGGVRALQRRLARWTDEIIHMSPERQEYFAYLGRPGIVIQYAPELRDPAWAADRVSLLTRRTPGELIAVHAGALRQAYAGDTLIRAFRLLDRDGVPARLVVLGGTAGRLEALEDLEQLLRRGTIEIRNPVPFSEVVPVLRGADVGVNLVLPIDTMHRLAQPRKLFEYFAAGLPVVVADVPTLRGIVGSRDLGEIADPRDPTAVADAIARLVTDSERRRSCAARARDYAYREGNWAMQETCFVSAVLGRS